MHIRKILGLGTTRAMIFLSFSMAWEPRTFAREEGFYPPAQVPTQPANYDRAVNASFQLHSDTAKCSGSFISKHGHYLTAAHCLQVFGGYYRSIPTRREDSPVQVSFGGSRTKAPVYSLIHFPNSTPGSVLPGGADGFGLRGGPSGAKLVLIGKSEASFNDDYVLTPEFPKETFENLIDEDHDYAIVKFDVSKSPVSCVPLSQKDVSVGDKVWMIGFPAANTRQNGFGSNGTSKLTSYGTVKDRIDSNDYIFEQKYSSEKVDALNRYYGAPHKFISDMDGFPGNSGSSVLNSKGEVVGVMNSGAMPTAEINHGRYVRDSSVSIRVSSILSDMRKFLPASEVDQILDCPSGGNSNVKRESVVPEKLPNTELNFTRTEPDSSPVSGGCRYTNIANERCCSEDIVPTWWCRDGERVKTETSCSVRSTAGSIWRCDRGVDSAEKPKENNNTKNAFAEPHSDKEITDLLCSQGEKAVCPFGTSTRTSDTRLSNFFKLRDRVQKLALAQVGKTVAEGGCVSPGEAAPYPGQEFGWIKDPSNTWTAESRTRRGICYSKLLEKEIYSVLGNRFSQQALAGIFEKVRSALKSAVIANSIGTNVLDSLRPEMLAEIDRVQLITADRYNEWGLKNMKPGDTHWASHGFIFLSNDDFGNCGPDFMKVNAMASSTGYNNVHTGMLAVVVCPMTILWAAQNESQNAESSWVHVLGHEMGHHIHAVRNRLAEGHVDESGNRLTTSFAPAFYDFASCMHKNFDQEIYPPEEPSSNSYRSKGLGAIIGRTPKGLDYQLAELSADYWGREVVLQFASKQSSQDAVGRMVYESAKRMCMQNGAIDEQSISHPSGNSRIRQLVLNPKIRKLMGCGSAGREIRSCGLLGEEN